MEKRDENDAASAPCEPRRGRPAKPGGARAQGIGFNGKLGRVPGTAVRFARAPQARLHTADLLVVVDPEQGDPSPISRTRSTNSICTW